MTSKDLEYDMDTDNLTDKEVNELLDLPPPTPQQASLPLDGQFNMEHYDRFRNIIQCASREIAKCNPEEIFIHYPPTIIAKAKDVCSRIPQLTQYASVVCAYVNTIETFGGVQNSKAKVKALQGSSFNDLNMIGVVETELSALLGQLNDHLKLTYNQFNSMGLNIDQTHFFMMSFHHQEGPICDLMIDIMTKFKEKQSLCVKYVKAKIEGAYYINKDQETRIKQFKKKMAREDAGLGMLGLN